MEKIILKNGDIELVYNDYMGYAVFQRVRYESGSTAFWQQISKWYQYKKYALDIYNAKQKPLILEDGKYTELIHRMDAFQVWKLWKEQVLNVGQVATWQQRHNHYFNISTEDQNNEQL